MVFLLQLLELTEIRRRFVVNVVNGVNGLTLCALLVLSAACGGGGDGTPVAPPTSPVPTPPPPPPPDQEDLVVPPAEAGKVASDRIAVTVTSSAGEPLSEAPYKWTTDEHSGWVFPAEGRADEEGRISGAWIPGFPGLGTLILGFSDGEEESTIKYETFSIAPSRPPSSAINLAIQDSLGGATGYSIDMTPLTEPLKTYYAALVWDGGYAGLQRAGSRYDRQLQFSLWNVPQGPATLEDAADGVNCRSFGGEGTGVACEAEYPWVVGGTYRFEMTEEISNGVSVISLQVTDLESGVSRYIGTLRFGRKANLTGVGVFVEDFDRLRPTCLEQPVRSAAFHRAMARTANGGWIPLVSATLRPHAEDAGNPGTPACANFDAREHSAGLEIVMGGTNVRDPHATVRLTIPR